MIESGQSSSLLQKGQRLTGERNGTDAQTVSRLVNDAACLKVKMLLHNDGP